MKTGCPEEWADSVQVGAHRGENEERPEDDPRRKALSAVEHISPMDILSLLSTLGSGTMEATRR
eukprot:scaffold146849_cov23-Tisochrysis_lutea.AAC.1